MGRGGGGRGIGDKLTRGGGGSEGMCRVVCPPVLMAATEDRVEDKAGGQLTGGWVTGEKEAGGRATGEGVDSG